VKLLPSHASLRQRLLLATFGAIAIAITLSGWTLMALFRSHVSDQFVHGLALQLDQIVSHLEFVDGVPVVDVSGLTDPRWHRPYSGLYWQIDTPEERGYLRSRSLWDWTLAAPESSTTDGEYRVGEDTGPANAAVIVLDRRIRSGTAPERDFRVLVAADTAPFESAVRSFRHQLTLSLLVLFLLLAASAAIQVSVGLAPLRRLTTELEAVRASGAPRVEGEFPAEITPLVERLNSVLEQNAAIVERARQQAGNLAHAVKTPLTVLQRVAEKLGTLGEAQRSPVAEASSLGQLVAEQVQLAQRHVDWHLSRARSFATLLGVAQASRVKPVVEALARVMARVHAERGIRIEVDCADAGVAFAGEEQDLHEILGNVVDNACKWASSRVRIAVERDTGDHRQSITVHVQDDGPGIPQEHIDGVLRRGARLDETVPGTGLGLAIVRDLVALYGGTLNLGNRAADGGGLDVEIRLPGVSAA